MGFKKVLILMLFHSSLSGKLVIWIMVEKGHLAYLDCSRGLNHDALIRPGMKTS